MGDEEEETSLCVESKQCFGGEVRGLCSVWGSGSTGLIRGVSR